MNGNQGNLMYEDARPVNPIIGTEIKEKKAKAKRLNKKRYGPLARSYAMGKLCVLCEKAVVDSNKSGNCGSCAKKKQRRIYGRRCTAESKKKISEANTAENNGTWVGDAVGYAGLHCWIKKRLPKPILCECCGIVPPRDLANKGTYDRNLDNWEWLCRRCHMGKDGRAKKFTVPTEPITLDHICEWCGKQYRAERKAQRFCSLHCTMKCRCSKQRAA